MIPESVYRKYSQAMFDIAGKTNSLETMVKDMKTVREVLRENEDLRKFLGNPLITAGVKKETLEQIFSGAVAPVVCQFLYVMVDRRREEAMTEAVDCFIDLARAAQNIEVAKIRLIKPLTAEEEHTLVAKLEELTGKKIEPLYYIDPTILGGVVIRIGDQVIDGSLKRQIRNMERSLLQGSAANEVTD